ncbi:hypothetical protein FHS45_001420 [Thalassobacillus devorans]|nr:hypothetical protein [Thalassobacillus devorans]
MLAGKTDRFPWACGELPQASPCGISPIMFIPLESHRFPSHHTFVSFSKLPSEIECFWSRKYGQLTIVIGYSSQNRAGLSKHDFEYLLWQGAWGKGETPAGEGARHDPAGRSPRKLAMFPAGKKLMRNRLGRHDTHKQNSKREVVFLPVDGLLMSRVSRR